MDNMFQLSHPLIDASLTLGPITLHYTVLCNGFNLWNGNWKWVFVKFLQLPFCVKMQTLFSLHLIRFVIVSPCIIKHFSLKHLTWISSFLNFCSIANNKCWGFILLTAASESPSFLSFHLVLLAQIFVSSKQSMYCVFITDGQLQWIC